MDWKTSHEIAGTFQNVIASAAVIIGALWAYFRFVRFRTLRPRLEFNFECSRSNIDDSHGLLILTVKLTNRGQTKVGLRKGTLPRCFLKYALIPESDPDAAVALLTIPPNRLEHLDIAFKPHGWIEPGETIDDVKVLKIRTSRLLAVQVELLVFGVQKWSASAAFPLIGGPASSSFKSEDEQDAYEEAEALREQLRNVVARIGRLDESERARFQSLIGEIDALLKESDTAFVSRAESLATKAEEALRATE